MEIFSVVYPYCFFFNFSCFLKKTNGLQGHYDHYSNFKTLGSIIVWKLWLTTNQVPLTAEQWKEAAVVNTVPLHMEMFQQESWVNLVFFLQAADEYMYTILKINVEKLNLCYEEII